VALPFWLIVLPVIGLLLIALVVALIVALTPKDRVRAGAEERAVRTVHVAGLGLGTVAGAWVLLEPTPFDRGLGSAAVLAPLCFGAITLLSVLAGEFLVRPRLAEGPRSAILRPRRLRDHLPRRLTRLVIAVSVVAVLLCAYTTLTASPDDQGRAGRALATWCSPTWNASSGPYPGSFYVVPYLLGLGVAATIALAAAVRISSRTLGSDPEVAERYRASGLTAVLGAYGLTLSTPLIGIAFFAGTSLLRHSCPQTGWTLVGWSALVIAVCAVSTALVSLVALLMPGTYSALDTTPAQAVSADA
jgi:hypothetical protein